MKKNLKSLILNHKSGFTLIELVIVFAIIGILSGLVMTNLTSVIQKSRDGQRKADLRQIQSALEIYRSDQGSYPITVLKNCPTSATDSTLTKLGNATACDKIYLNSVPHDPSGGDYSYNPTVGGKAYALVACLERDNDPDIDLESGEKVHCLDSGGNPIENRWRHTLNNP